ncbi:MAG: VWA domain-containing protein [Chloroflexi bacterium]|nr:VWA domain-containing protein [Chloroflexota bacterium]
MNWYAYSRWDGRQDVPSFDEDSLMDQLSDQVISQGDLATALRSLMQRGARDSRGRKLAGVQDLLQKLRARRQDLFDTYDLNSVMRDVSKRLEDILDTERQGIEKRLQEVGERSLGGDSSQGIPRDELLQMMERLARRNQEFLDSLPQEPLGAIQQLLDYEFMDEVAQEKFDQLLKDLQQKVIDSHFKDMSQRLQSMSPSDLEQLKDMLRDLNQMLEDQRQGDKADFQRFMEKYGHMLGPQPPSSLEELAESIRQRASQMRSLLNSMSPEMRQELRQLLNSALADEELQGEMTRLDANLARMSSQRGSTPEYPFHGRDPLTLEEALGLMEQLQGMDRLEKQLRKAQHGDGVQEVGEELIQELLGEEALEGWTHLRSLTDVLEEAGYIRRSGTRFELTPKGIRRIGNKALQEIFFLIKRDHIGGHRTPVMGKGGEHQGDTKRYEFGDPFSPHIQKSLMNAIMRDSSGVPVRLQGEDFEVYRPEQISQASTVLMIDLSLSMAMRGNFVAAKKVALALDSLIRTQFPRDNLYVVGFSTYALEVKPEKLPSLNWDEFDPYTNIQHGLVLSRKLLSRIPGGTKQIVLVSDGEPTAHVEGGQLYIQYPPSARTIRETLKEVKRCTHQGILINTFLLDRNRYLVDFVEQMTRINRGRVFYTSPERLGEYILVDYVSHRQRVLS